MLRVFPFLTTTTIILTAVSFIVLLTGCTRLPLSSEFSPPPSHYPSSGDPPNCAQERLERLIRNTVSQPDSMEIKDTWIIRFQPGVTYGLTMLFLAKNEQGVWAEYEAYGPIDRTDCSVSLEDIHNSSAFDYAITGMLKPDRLSPSLYCNTVFKPIVEWNNVIIGESYPLIRDASTTPSLRLEPGFTAEVSEVEQSMREVFEDLRRINPPLEIDAIHTYATQLSYTFKQHINRLLLDTEQALDSTFDHEIDSTEKFHTFILPTLQDYCS